MDTQECCARAQNRFGWFGNLHARFGRRARRKAVTTHWQNIEQLAKRYPQLLIEKDPIFVKDGNVHTSAGAIAGIDLALSLVEDDLGTTVATSIARDLVLYLRRSGCEAQHSKLLAQQSNVEGTRMRNLPSWARSNVAQKLDIGALAKAVAMSPRTFVRQFDLRFRTTPANWVQSLRVEAACAFIVAQELPLKAIATLAGFRDEQALRRAFLRQLSMTPKQYREHHGRLTFDCPLRRDGTEESAVEGTSSLSDHAVWRISEDTGETVAPQRRNTSVHVAA
jgi:transcriptional regulator GlxA family with amidase domain